MKEIFLAYGIPNEIVDGIMMLYCDTKAQVSFPDGDTDFFNITAGVLQGDTFSPYGFVICLDYVLRKAFDHHTNLGFTLQQRRSRRFPAKNITDADYADDLVILANNIVDAEKLLHNLENAASEIGLYINVSKTKFMTLNVIDGSITSINGENIEKVDDFQYLGSFVASTSRDVDVRIGKAWSAINNMSQIWESNLSTRIKKSFFRATVESILIYGSTTWTLTASLERKLNGTYTRMLRAALNVSWQDHIPNNILYGETPLLSETIQRQRLGFACHCWRNKNELAGELVLWDPTHGQRKIGRPALVYPDILVRDTGCQYNELPNAMSDRDNWRNRVKLCRASSTQ